MIPKARMLRVFKHRRTDIQTYKQASTLDWSRGILLEPPSLQMHPSIAAARRLMLCARNRLQRCRMHMSNAPGVATQWADANARSDTSADIAPHLGRSATQYGRPHKWSMQSLRGPAGGERTQAASRSGPDGPWLCGCSYSASPRRS